MDDIIVLSKTKWQLRRAIQCVNQHFDKLGLKQHPDKTFIGRISSGFDFLGYQFGEQSLSPLRRTLLHHINRLLRLYEQKKSHPNRVAILDNYRQHWLSWVSAGLTAPFTLNDDVHLFPSRLMQTTL